MPLPFIIGGIAAVAGAAGIGSGIHGGIKMKEANDTMEMAKWKQEKAVTLFNDKNAEITKLLDDLGKQELSILNSFKDFSDLMEKIQGRPEFKAFNKDGINLPEYEAEELKKVSTAAGVILGGLGGAASGIAGGVAAAGATTTAVMAVGTASTGTAISTLSGAAATNATLAALGGGAIGTSSTAGGMALGSLVLGGATIGVGLLVGGFIFNSVGSNLSDKADEALLQAQRTEDEVNKIVGYFIKLGAATKNFQYSLTMVENEYRKYLSNLDNIVNTKGKVFWSDFTESEKMITKNLSLLVGVLYQMCKTKLVLKSENDTEPNKVNRKDIDSSISNADKLLTDLSDII